MKKRILKLTLITALFMLFAPIMANAASSGKCGGNVNYSLDDAGKLTISGSGAMYNYSYSGGPWMDYYTLDISEVVIEDGVTNVGENAFNGCLNLQKITIGDSVTKIGYQSFKGCSKLTDISFGNGVTTISESAFMNCYRLKKIDLPESVKTIGQRAFCDCKNLTEAILGMVTSIDTYAFFNTSLTEVVIPDSVTTIGESAFGDNMKKVTLGSGIIKIGVNAFLSSYNTLEDVYISDMDAYLNINFANNYSNPMYSAKNLYLNGAPVTSVDISEGVTSIPIYAFNNCSSLTSISIPSSLKNIGAHAFYGCNNLIEISVPDIGTYVNLNFADDYSCPFVYVNENVRKILIDGKPITSADIPEGITSIPLAAFYNCADITVVSLPDSLKEIKTGAFMGCSIREITIPENVTNISGNVFKGCAHLETVNFNAKNCAGISPKDKTVNYRFSDCPSLNTVNIGDAVVTVPEYMFAGCESITSVNIGKNVKTIGTYAFYVCKNISEIFIPDNVTLIENGAFQQCEGASSLTMGSGITTIYMNTFNGCTNLRDISIGNNVAIIGEKAFNGCANLTEITIPDSVTTIYRDAFADCTRLLDVTLGSGIRSMEGLPFNNDTALDSVYISDMKAYLNISYKYGTAGPMYYANKLYLNGQIVTSVIVPDGVSRIPASAFRGLKDLRTVAIPSGVSIIDENAFDGCSNLTSLIISDGVSTIGDRAFQGCSSLYSTVIPDSVTRIGSYAFNGCTSLTSAPIGNSVKYIGSRAFANTAISTIRIPYCTTELKDYVFYNCKNLTTLNFDARDCKVGDESVLYEQTGEFFSAFPNCDALSTINFGYSVVNIQDYAFRGLKGLRKVTISDRVQRIGREAFKDCGNITDVYYTGSQEQWRAIDFRLDNLDLMNANIHYNCDVPIMPTIPPVPTMPPAEDIPPAPQRTPTPTPTPAPTPTPTPTPAPTLLPTTTAEITKEETDTAYTFTVTSETAYENCFVYAAIYNADGALVALDRVPLELTGSTTVSVDKQENGVTAKVFVWSDFMQSIIEHAEEFPLVE